MPIFDIFLPSIQTILLTPIQFSYNIFYQFSDALLHINGYGVVADGVEPVVLSGPAQTRQLILISLVLLMLEERILLLRLVPSKTFLASNWINKILTGCFTATGPYYRSQGSQRKTNSF